MGRPGGRDRERDAPLHLVAAWGLAGLGAEPQRPDAGRRRRVPAAPLEGHPDAPRGVGRARRPEPGVPPALLLRGVAGRPQLAHRPREPGHRLPRHGVRRPRGLGDPPVRLLVGLRLAGAGLQSDGGPAVPGRLGVHLRALLRLSGQGPLLVLQEPDAGTAAPAAPLAVADLGAPGGAGAPAVPHRAPVPAGGDLRDLAGARRAVRSRRQPLGPASLTARRSGDMRMADDIEGPTFALTKEWVDPSPGIELV